MASLPVTGICTSASLKIININGPNNNDDDELSAKIQKKEFFII